MTTRTFSSQSKMGRNPFAAKSSILAAKPAVLAGAAVAGKLGLETPKAKFTRHEPRMRIDSERAYETVDAEGILLAFIALPVRSVMFGLKSLLVVRYLFAHPREWRF